LVGFGDPVGVLSTVSQQIQSDRALLVVWAFTVELRVFARWSPRAPVHSPMAEQWLARDGLLSAILPAQDLP
jgi:hypothetical protein